MKDVCYPLNERGPSNFSEMSKAYIFIALIFEERDLKNHIGQEYNEYKKSIPNICPFSFK